MQHPNVTFVGPLTWRGISRNNELQLGLLSLAAVLKPRGVTPQIIDLNLLSDAEIEQEAIATILDTGPDIVGFGSMCNSFPLTLRLAAEIKRARPSITIVLGGPQASVVDRPAMLAFPCIDFVVRGEAERSFPELLEALAESTPLSRVQGITYRRDRRVVRNPNASVIQDLDDLPLPLYDYYPGLEQYTSLYLEAGRGCPFACRFCSTNDFFRRKYRLKSAAKLISQMVLLSDRYGVRDFQLTHDMFTVDRKRVAAFCQSLLDQNLKFQWRCSARTDCVDDELLSLMARAGCAGIFFGIETGSQRLQHLVEKDLDLSAAHQVLRTASRIGISTTASLITGYPQENPEDLDGTIGFFGETTRLETCEPQLHLLSPLAETPLETEYRDRLVYDRISSDISGDRESLHPVDELLVLAHPEIFPNFYALPCPIDRQYLQHLRAFLLVLSVRAKGLLLAAHSECGGLRKFFDDWRAANTALPVSNYQSREFFDSILSHIEFRYLNTGRIGMEVMWRFYSALEIEARQSPTAAIPATPWETHVRLTADMRLVTMKGDIIGVFAALRNATPPEPALQDRICTLAVEISEGGKNRILELSPLAAAILVHCRQGITVSALEVELARKGISVHLPEALEILQRQGLLEVTQPEPAALSAVGLRELPWDRSNSFPHSNPVEAQPDPLPVA